ncbi:hypothetical protein GXW82_39475 [Streptacidiphilus sp. 4-A2]|nr:hypothetical protein [Streptacidiphilus sp. 4-A2]
MGAIDDARDLQQQTTQNNRARILAETDGGHAGPTGYTTDFTASGIGGLDGLRAMVEHADPSALDTVAGHWTSVSKALSAVQTDFQTHTSAALENWTGAAADGFAARAQQLHASLGNGAQYAQNTSTGVAAASAALKTAKQNMPTAPSEWQQFSRKMTSESGDQQFEADLRNGISRSAALKLDGGQLSAMEERHQQAIVVMQTLEGEYHSAAKTIGPAPNKPVGGETVWPPPPATVKHSPVTGTDGEPVAGPNSAGPLRLAQDGTPDRGGSADGFVPGQGRTRL